MNVARVAYTALADMWTGLRNAVDAHGPAGILAATGGVILFLWLVSGGRL